MNLVSSAVKMSSATESSTCDVKTKRKSCRRRAMASRSEGSPIENELPCEKTRHGRRAHHDVRNESYSSAGDVKSSCKGRSNLNDASTRRRSTQMNNRHPTIKCTGGPSLVAFALKNRPQKGLTLPATSSHSKRLDKALCRDVMTYHHSSSDNNNNSNNTEFDDDNKEAEPETFSENWLVNTRASNNGVATRVLLPSRANKYRNLSAGVNKKPRARGTAIPVPKELSDRPPSRQRHAFPTHLIDVNAFDAPPTTGRRGGSSCSSVGSSGARMTDEGSTLDRPPSRYMVKAKRSGNSAQDGSTLSRRDVVDKSIVFSCNQSHHDPKTDGFADVDESVPPPFRIKVTTDTTIDLPCHTFLKSPPGLAASKRSRNTKRWPSNNHEQLLRMAVRGGEDSRGSDQTMPTNSDPAQNQLQWFGKDDQINNAHLFETVISLPSPKHTPRFDVDFAIEDDLEDSSRSPYHSRIVISKQDEHQQEPANQVETHFPSRRAAAASKMTTPTTTLSETDNPEDQWIQSSTNPFFINSSSTVDYDLMDPETAIEQTPLYSSKDLMTLAATEMTDLRLDDYTAFSDISQPAPPPSTSEMGWSDARLTPASRSPPLGTSLGKDFLSLFAQY